MKLFLVLLLFSAPVFADGDKNRSQNPVFIEEDQCAIAVPGIDLDDCAKIPAPSQAGVTVYFCTLDEVTVTCVED